jgi:3-hydroxy-9,10-secoandrosta-1,3,5(10)-triene-9,17-dione monooxygenase
VMRAEAVAGGYRLSGEAGWGSGINHSTWIIVGGMLPGEGPGPEWTLFLIPPGQYEVIDTWHTIGMRGTGSNTARISGVFVPSAHTLRISDMREGRGPGAALSNNPIYRAPWATYAPLNFLVPGLGAARGAVEYNRRWNAERSSKHGAQVASYVSIQTRLARCGADLDTARWLIDRAVDTAESPEPPTLEQRARVCRDTCRASELIVSTIDTVMTMSGANGYLVENPIQRAWRDIHLASSHVILNPEVGLALWGRQQLGLEPPEGAQWY